MILRHTTGKALMLMLTFLLTLAARTEAQNDPQFVQYWALPSFYNPAQAGNIDYIRIRLGANLQWVGIENAPQSFVGTADMPVKLGKKQRIGVGVSALQESIGLYSNLLIGAQAAYKFKALKGVFSIGIQPAYYSTKFKGTEVYIPEGDDYHQPDDEAIPKQDVAGQAFDLSAGISYTHKYFSIGISGLHLLEPKIELSEENAAETETAQFSTVLRRQMYFTADGNIPIRNSLFSLQPSILVRTDFSNFSAEATMRATYKRFISFGIAYRWKDAVSAMVAAEFKNFFLGYAYSYPLSPIYRGSSGSHELVAGYMIKLNYGDKNKNRHRSIRIM